MEQSKHFLSHHPVDEEDEREVCKILLNLKYLIKKRSNLSHGKLPVWGSRGRRSAINLSPSPPRQHPPEKKVRIGAGDSSPASPLSFESHEKTQHQYIKKVLKKKTREELLETIIELTQARESLTNELEKVKGHHNKLRAYNMELKAKQQELQFQQREPTIEPKKNINTIIKLNQNTTPFPLLLENRQPYHPQFLNLIQQQQNLIFPYPCSQTGLYSSTSGLPDLNVSADEVFEMDYSQPLDQNVKMIGDGNKVMIAAEARKRRMVKVKGRKLKC